MTHDRQDPVERLDRPEDVLADLGVGLHHRPFLVGQRAGLVQDRLRNANLPDVVQDGSELDAANRLELELELCRHADGEPDDLFGVLARDSVLRLERVRERGERLAVESLRPLLVLEAGHERADMGRRQLREIALGPGKDTRARVVDLDQAPGQRLDDQRNDQHRLHLHLFEDEELGRICARVVSR